MKSASSFTGCVILLICTALPVMLLSCSAPKYVYSPATANLLQIENRKDVKVAVNYATADNGSVVGKDNRKSAGADVQAAFAAGKRIVIRVDAYTKSEQNQTALENDLGIPEEKNIYKKRGMSVAAGVYNFSKDKEASMFQLNGGIGFGKTSFVSYYNSYPGAKGYYAANYVRFFLQPAVVIRLSENYTGTIANTFSLMNYKSIRTDISNIKNEPLGLIGTKPSFFSEFMLQNEFGFRELRGIRFQAQLGISTLLTKFHSQQYDYHKVWLAMGVVADVNMLLRKNKQ
jgi:hypothetical protein